MTSLTLLLTLLLTEARAACHERHDSRDLLHLSQVAMREFADQRMSAFFHANAEATAWIPCLQDVLTADAAAAWYQVQGVQAFLDRRAEDMERYFQIARYLDPELTLGEGVVPEGHPMSLAWANAVLAPPFGREPLDGKLRGSLYVDGLESLDLPADRPFLAQLVSEQGVPVRTWIVPSVMEAPDRLTGRTQAIWARGLGLGAAGTASIAAGLWIASAASLGGYEELASGIGEAKRVASDQERAAYERSVARTNALGVGAQVATGLAVGMGLSALVLEVRF